MKKWAISDALKLYNIEHWGDQYFNIGQTGNLTVHPEQGDGEGIDIMKVLEDVKDRGFDVPVLFRFQDIIRKRVVHLNEAFRKSIQEAQYKGRYQGVYPIKVNQMREVVEEILDAGEPYDFGLETGSKAELSAAIAMETPERALIICNGYKDDDFIKMALMGRRLGKNVIIVVEKLSELYQILRISDDLEIEPRIGIRAKLYARGSGKWESSGGEFAKFGLTTPEMIHVVKTLKECGLEHTLNLIHFHIGSQVTSIRTIKDAVREITRIYAKLQKMDLNIEYLDVGGGLGVDYDGSRTNFDSSMNYSLDEYVSDVVYSIQEVCESEGVKEPHIVSESGRALVAHHSVLVVDAFGSIEPGSTPVELECTAEEATVVEETRYIYENLTNKNLLESYHDIVQRKEESVSLFNLGYLSLEDRAKVEHLFWLVCKKIYKSYRAQKFVPEEIEVLEKYLADQYLCNFSVFQSMLDHWAIEHLFPIVPLHRHLEQPTQSGTIVDITCDSDGKVSKFIDFREIKDTLPLHALREGENYYIGIFLMGAYQDIMGDLHNLFGRVNEVHVFLDESEPGGYYLEELIQGESISDVLAVTQYSSAYLKKRVKDQIDCRVRKGEIKGKERVELLKFYERVLHGYTYMKGRYQSQKAAKLSVSDLKIKRSSEKSPEVES